MPWSCPRCRCLNDPASLACVACGEPNRGHRRYRIDWWLLGGALFLLTVVPMTCLGLTPPTTHPAPLPIMSPPPRPWRSDWPALPPQVELRWHPGAVLPPRVRITLKGIGLGPYLPGDVMPTSYFGPEKARQLLDTGHLIPVPDATPLTFPDLDAAPPR